MPFAGALRKSLQDRASEVPRELMRGDTLEDVLNRHLRTVERLGGGDVYTCILLLNPDGKTLSYGAAPTVPATFCRAADAIEVGLRAGSCGAAVYLRRPVYSVDIQTDPLWENCRDLPLHCGFKSSWPTPIWNSAGAIIGSFAILHKSVGTPTPEEIEAIDMITEHVAQAIMWFRDWPDHARNGPPKLTLVTDNSATADRASRLLALIEKLLFQATELDGYALNASAEEVAQDFRSAAELCRKVAANLKTQIQQGTLLR